MSSVWKSHLGDTLQQMPEARAICGTVNLCLCAQQGRRPGPFCGVCVRVRACVRVCVWEEHGDNSEWSPAPLRGLRLREAERASAQRQGAGTELGQRRGGPSGRPRRILHTRGDEGPASPGPTDGPDRPGQPWERQADQPPGAQGGAGGPAVSLCLPDLSVSREGSRGQLPSSRLGLGTVTREGGRGRWEVRGHSGLWAPGLGARGGPPPAPARTRMSSCWDGRVRAS